MFRIFAVAKYESLMLLRTWKFWILAIIGMSIPLLMVVTFTLLTYFGEIDEGIFYIKDTTAYLLFYFYNYIVGLVIVFLCSDFFAKDRKSKVEEVITSRAISNTEYITGKYLGVVVPLSVLSLIVVLLSTIFTSIFLKTFTLYSFLRFFFLINLPTIIFLTAFIIFISSFVRNPGIVFVLIAAYITVTIIIVVKKMFSANELFRLLDFGCFFIPLFPSEIIGIPNIEKYLQQRLFYILFGVFFISITVPFYKRLKQSRLEIIAAVGISILSVIFAAGIFKINLDEELRRRSLVTIENQVGEEYSGKKYYKVTDYNILIKFSGQNKRIAAESEMRLERLSNNAEEIVFSLNPGLKVESILIDKRNVNFKREGSAIILKGLSDIPEQVNIKISYSGYIDRYFSTIEHEKKDQGILRKYDGPFMKGDFYDYTGPHGVYLLENTGWYPVLGILKKDKSDFFKTKLSVSVRSDLTPVTVGRLIETKSENGLNTFVFNSETPVKSIPLIISKFDKISGQFGDLKLNLYYFPKHSVNIQFLANVDSVITDVIGTYLETLRDVTSLKYPYEELNFVEVPLQIQWYPENGKYYNALAQPYISILREELVLTRLKERFDRIKRRNRRRRIEESVAEMKKRAFIEFINNNFLENDLWNEDKYANPLYSFWTNWFEFAGKGKAALNFYFTDFLTVWLDEKLTERFYPDRNKYTAQYGRNEEWYYRWQLGIESDSLFGMLENTPITGATDNKYAKKTHALNTYKDIRVFQILKEVIGEETFSKVLKESINTFKYDEFNFERFQTIAENVYGKNLDWYFDDFIYGTSFPGFSVLSHETFKVKGGKKGVLYQTKALIRNNEQNDGYINFIVRLRTGDKSRFVKIPAGKIAEVGIETNTEPQRLIIDPIYAKNRDDFSFSLASAENVSVFTSGRSTITVVVSESGGKNKEKDSENVRKEGSWEGVKILDEFELEHNEYIVDDLSEEFFVSKELKSKYLRPKGNEGGWKIRYDDDSYGEYVRTCYRKYAKDAEDNAVWNFTIPKAGDYEIFAYIPKGTYWKAKWMERTASRRFHYLVRNGTFSENIDLDFKLAENGWNTLGIFHFNENDNLKVVLQDKGDGRLYADAVKIVCQ